MKTIHPVPLACKVFGHQKYVPPTHGAVRCNTGPCMRDRCVGDGHLYLDFKWHPDKKKRDKRWTIATCEYPGCGKTAKFKTPKPTRMV